MKNFNQLFRIYQINHIVEFSNAMILMNAFKCSTHISII